MPGAFEYEDSMLVEMDRSSRQNDLRIALVSRRYESVLEMFANADAMVESWFSEEAPKKKPT